MKDWLFRKLFPEQYARSAYLDFELSRAQVKFSTLQRSPLDESEWVRKFVALDGDYMALEKEASELRIRNLYLSLRVKELEAK
jgi:hypothetical protein